MGTTASRVLRLATVSGLLAVGGVIGTAAAAQASVTPLGRQCIVTASGSDSIGRIQCYLGNTVNARAAVNCYRTNTGAFVGTRYGTYVTNGPSQATCAAGTYAGEVWVDWAA
jgi:hypothetical protein